MRSVPSSACVGNRCLGDGSATSVRQLYDDLGLRQDSLFELLDAMLTSPQRSTLVRHSLSTVFRRRWPSTCDALSDGSIDTARLRRLFAQSLADSALVEGRPVWVIDGTNWPRPAARASADRTWEYRPLPGWPQNGVVPAWSYQWLVAVPEVAGSWVLPLEVRRRGPTAKSATQVALDQITAVRRAQNADAPRPVVTLDSGYDLETLARSTVDADLLVRLAKHRVVYRAPEQHAGRGRPRLHGEPFRLAEDATHGQPQRSQQLQHAAYGASPGRCLDRSPRRRRAGCPVQRRARPGGTSAEQEVATATALARLDRRSAPSRPERAVALVPAAVHRRARLPLFQTDARLDHRPPAPPSGCRPLDVPGGRRLLATVAGSPTAQRRSPALGASPIGSLAHSRPGPAPLLSTIGPGGHSSSRTSATWKIPRSPRWPASRCRHSTTKWRAALLRVPLDLSNFVQTSML